MNAVIDALEPTDKVKYSRYNSIINLSDQISVVYNAAADRSLVLRNEKVTLLDFSPHELRRSDPGIFHKLLSIEAIVPESKDELQEIMQRSKEVDHADTEYTLIINPTMNCNFKCWYCYESHIVGSRMSEETIHRIYKHIDRVLENPKLKEFTLSLFGGEPLMYYNKVARPIVDCLRSKYAQYPSIKFSILFTSNAFLMRPNILEHLLNVNDYKHFQITLDGSREVHNLVRVARKEDGSYDKILSVIKTLITQGIDVLLRINYTARSLASTPEILADISDIPAVDRRHLSISFHRVWQDKDDADTVGQTSMAIISDFRDAGFVVSDNEILDNLNNPCYADRKNEAVINFNGDVYKCTARDFNEENKFGEITIDGTIAWNDRIDTWEHIKIQSKACQNCRILPICGGGCYQVNMEAHGLDICQMGFDSDKKDEIVMNRVVHAFEMNEQTT